MFLHRWRYLREIHYSNGGGGTVCKVLNKVLIRKKQKCYRVEKTPETVYCIQQIKMLRFRSLRMVTEAEK